MAAGGEAMIWRVEQECIHQSDFEGAGADVERFLIRCDRAASPIVIADKPDATFILLESKEPVHLTVAGLPSLTKIFLQGDISLDASLDLELEAFEICQQTTPILIPPTQEVIVKDGVLLKPTLEAPEAVAELSMSYVEVGDHFGEWLKLCRNLRRLYLLNATGLKSEHLTLLNGLQKLELLDCGDIQDIDFVRQNPDLQTLNLGGETRVRSGDLSLIFDLEHLEFVLFANRLHYNARVKEYSGKPSALVRKWPKDHRPPHPFG